MLEQLAFRQLERSDLHQMHEAFNEAFSDYLIYLQLDFDQFQSKIIDKLSLDFAKSIGAFDGDKLVGFIFNTVEYYEQKLTAYNGGTGVVPGYRGMGITEALYNYFFTLMEGQQIEQCLLEVVTENKVAIRVYKKIGFVESKYFHCFKLATGKLDPTDLRNDLTIKEFDTFRWDTYERCSDIFPSFLDTKEMLVKNRRNEVLIEVHKDDQCIGFAIFHPVLGRINQMAVCPEHRGQKVGLNMLNYIHKRSDNKYLSVMNVNQHAYQLVEFLLRCGFENQLDQYQMTYPIF